MLIYIVNFALNMALGFLSMGLHPREASAKRRAVYLAITAVQLALLCGLRGETVGFDTDNYIRIFDSSISDLTTGEYNSTRVELGFYYLCLLIGILGGDATTLLLLCAFFIMGATCLFIYRHSDNVLLSVFVILCFPFYYSSFDIVRHYVALSFFLLAYKYLEEKKPIPYFLIVLAGFIFHKVAVLFVFVYFIRHLRNTPITWALFGTGSVIFCFFTKDIARVVIDLAGRLSGYVSEESTWLSGFGGGIKTAVLYGAILILALILYNNLENREEKDERALHYVLILFCFSVVFINVRMMIRFIVTFIPLLAIAFPRLNAPENARDTKTTRYVTLAFMALGIFYHGFMLLTNWQNVVPYVSVFSQ
ncbi:MAG: EpsG family protein [Clostridia bacterium]|nr:EpsG family protein [Clostridia bacterium]